jgi:hypothetical protein
MVLLMLDRDEAGRQATDETVIRRLAPCGCRGPSCSAIWSSNLAYVEKCPVADRAVDSYIKFVSVAEHGEKIIFWQCDDDRCGA